MNQSRATRLYNHWNSFDRFRVQIPAVDYCGRAFAWCVLSRLQDCRVTSLELSRGTGATALCDAGAGTLCQTLCATRQTRMNALYSFF